MELYRKERSPYWYMDVTVPGIKGPERVRKSTKRTDKTEAMRVMATFVKERLDSEQLGVKKTMTLGEAVARYQRESKGSTNVGNLINRTNKLIGLTSTGAPNGRWHIDPNTPLHRITTATVRELRTARMDEGNAPGTANIEVQGLQRIYNLARTEWDVQVHPNVLFPKAKVAGKLRYLTPQEEARLLKELDPHRQVKVGPQTRREMQDAYDLCVFLLDTGARYSEIASITWNAVDASDWKTVNIYRSKVGNEGVLTMTARLREILQRRHATAVRKIYVFPARGDETKPRGYAPDAIKRAMNRAGLNEPHMVKRFGRCTVHTLRDTFATRLAMAGVSLYKIQKLLGHSSPVMTQKYAKLSDVDAADEAAGVLDKLQGVA